MNPDTLSVLIFDGKASKVSRALSWLCRDASHVGLVIPAYVAAEAAKIKGYDWKPVEDWYIFESTTENTCDDVFTGKKIRGVAVVPYRARIDSYEGTISMRRLERQSNVDVFAWHNIDTLQLAALVAEYHGLPYEKSLGRLAGALLDRINIFNTDDERSIFCSELVALIYQRLGILEKREPAEEAHPGDFAVNKNGQLAFIDGNRFLLGYSFSPMVEV